MSYTVPFGGMGRPPEKVTFMGMTFERLPTMGMAQPLEKLPIMRVAWPENKPLNMSMPRLDKVPMNMGGPKPPPEVKIPNSHKAVMGSIAGMFATTAVHPLDVIKVRMQLFPRQRTANQMLQRILNCEGARGLYVGLTAGLLRQATYTTTRLGVYGSLYDNYKTKHGKSPSVKDRLCIAVAAGLAGAFAGSPSEVALVRMVAARRARRSRCSPGCARACRAPAASVTALAHLYRMVRDEGFTSMWCGATPTLVRSVFVSIAQVGTYSEMHLILKARGMSEGLEKHFYTTIVSCFATAILSLPVDIVKTQYQALFYKYQVPLMDVRRMTMLEIITSMYRRNGVLFFWRGFLPYYTRMCAHTMLMYIVLEIFTSLYKRASK